MGLTSYRDMATNLVERADQAVREGARKTLAEDSSPENIERAFLKAGVAPKDREQIAKHFPDKDSAYRFDEAEGWQQQHRWFVATFAPRLHEKVKRGAAEKGWVFACPMATEMREVPLRLQKPKQPKKVAVDVPLFGTYAFLRPVNSNNPDFVAQERVDGLGKLLRRPMTRELVTVPMGQVERFMLLQQEGFFDKSRPNPPKVKRLDRIVVTAGPFEGIRAIVEMTAGERVKVLMEMLGSVELPIDAVELAS